MKKDEDILAKWLSNEISDAELEASEGTAAINELKQVTKEVDQWSMPKYNTDIGYLKMKDKLQVRPPNNLGSKWLKIIVIVSVIGVLLFGLLSFFGNRKEELKAEAGEHINLAFQDGSEVWLNDGSSIEYDTRAWSTERTIELQGEALFEVSKGSPFTVNTPNGKVTVLGTQFNVRAWGKKLLVECYEGKVQVRSGAQVTVITANESVHVVSGKMRAKQNMSNTGPAWQEGDLRFYEDQLTVVCDELERQYQIAIDLKASDRLFTGNFREGDLDKALRSICMPLGLDYTISPDKKSVVIE